MTTQSDARVMSFGGGVQSWGYAALAALSEVPMPELAACEAALEAIRSDADVDWMLNVESQCCAAIAKARVDV